ncbi:hypothetical protein [Bacillus sp. CECT 9360]|uniref:hypothetical protein n=1 Tax=Bacillus sp. CECT 9360 TaxID=2845821 RepID=UPI001E5CB667|nr:hypothetical protein [Bacillus sp. CECT 9360]CAH0345827.1 hypothetical protein BCI9360_02128 [Bacillus sp. CECT 9360]
MKKLLVMIMTAVFFLGGCMSEQDQGKELKTSKDIEVMQQTHASDKANSEESDDIVLGVDKVLSIIKEVETAMENSADPKRLHAIGQQMEEEWDTIEKKVEKKFPVDYKSIEESLYPLIAELGKSQHDLAKIKDLSDQTKAKLDLFKIKAKQ